MKMLCFLSVLLLLCIPSIAQPTNLPAPALRSLSVSTNGVVVSPTNFWNVGATSILEALGISLGEFGTNWLALSTASSGRSQLGLGEQTTNTTAAGWRGAIGVSEHSTNTTAAGWRGVLGLDVGTPGAVGTNLLTTSTPRSARSLIGVAGGPSYYVTRRNILHTGETLPLSLPETSLLLTIANTTNSGTAYLKRPVGAGSYQSITATMATNSSSTVIQPGYGTYSSGTAGDVIDVALSDKTALASIILPTTNTVDMPQASASHIYPYPSSYAGSGTFSSGTTYRTVIQGSNVGGKAPYSGTITGVEFWYNNSSTNWSELYIDTWRNVSGNDYQLISRSENLNTQLFAHGTASAKKSVALTCNALSVTAGDYVGITILSGDATSRAYTSTKTVTGANSISYFSASSSIGDTKTFTLSANSIWFLKYTLIYPSGGMSSTATVQMPWNATYNFTTVAGTPISSGTYYLMLANRYGQRAPFSGWLDKVSFISISNVNLTNLTIMSFRDTGTGNGPFSRNWVSGDLKSQQSGSGTNIVTVTLDAPKWVNSGDIIGVRFMLSSSGQGTFYAADPAADANNNACYYATADPADWLSVSGSVLISSYFPIKLWMRPPLVTLSGDSLIRGYHGDGNYYGATAYQMEKALGLPVHGNGVGSQNFLGGSGTSIADRFYTNTIWSVVGSGAKIAIVEGGVNDIANSIMTVSAYTNSWVQAIMLPAQTAGMYVVGSSIWPWTAGTTEQMQLRDQCNAALESLLAEFPNTALYVDLDSTLGQNRVGGDPGNLWDIKTAYRSGDSIHLNTAGYAAFSAHVASQVIPWLEGLGVVP